MKAVTKEEMESIDRQTSEIYQFPSTLLMENAGIAIALKVLELYPDILSKQTPIAILIGPGNNGGDGLVIARYLFTNGIPVHCYICGTYNQFKGDSLLNLNIVQKLSIPHTFIENEQQWKSLSQTIFQYKYIIDSLFGTGLRGELRDFYQQIVNDINQNPHSGKQTITSVDVPSGLHSIIDAQNKCVLKCDSTITVGLPKIGMLDYPGKEYTGSLHIVQIGFPEKLLRDEKILGHWITHQMVKLMLPQRKKDSHKGTYGHLLIIAGCRKYTGAAILVSEAGLRVGPGLVTLATVPPSCQTLRNHLPEIITLELSETNDGMIHEKSFSEIEEMLPSYQSIVIGPGIGQSFSTGNFIYQLLQNYSGKIVLDADALNILSENISWLKTAKGTLTLTPHIKEMARLLNIDTSTLNKNKIPLCKEFSRTYQVTIVLKSSVTMIFHPDGRYYFNSTGNEGMATGGSGDVLAGIIGGLMVQGMPVLDASITGVYIHGLSGDIALKRKSSYSLIASDITHSLPEAFNLLCEEMLR